VELLLGFASNTIARVNGGYLVTHGTSIQAKGLLPNSLYVKIVADCYQSNVS
jgi:hypothetical protein